MAKIPKHETDQTDKIEEEARSRSDAELNGKPETIAQQSATKFRFKKVAAVAVQLFKMAPGLPERYFLCDGPMFVGKKVEEKKEPATLMNVTDLETGEEGQIIVGAVLRELLNEKYPADGYVGRKFAIKVHKQADKKYNTYGVVEIEPE